LLVDDLQPTTTDIELHTKRKGFWIFTQWRVFHQSELSVFIKFDSNEVSYPGTLLKEPINANHQSIRKCLKLMSASIFCFDFWSYDSRFAERHLPHAHWM